MQAVTMSVREFRARVGISQATTYKLINEGIIESVKVANRRLILVSSVDSLLDPHKSEDERAR